MYATTLEAVDPALYEILLVATDREFRDTHPAHWANAVIYRPTSLMLGLGCHRGASAEMVERGVLAILARHNLSVRSVKAIATVDRKADEPAFLYLRDRYGWPLETYPAEAAALLCAGAAVLLLPKQVYTEPGAGRAMTLAVARIPYPKRRAVQSVGGHG